MKKFAGALHKSFKTLQEAQLYLESKEIRTGNADGGAAGMGSVVSTAFPTVTDDLLQKESSKKLKLDTSATATKATITRDGNSSECTLTSVTSEEFPWQTDRLPRIEILPETPLNAIVCDGELQYLYTAISDSLLKERIAPLLDPKYPFRAYGTHKKASNFEAALERLRQLEGVMEESPDDWETVFTDGACIMNGKIGAKAGIGVYWATLPQGTAGTTTAATTAGEDPRNLSCKLSGKQTNNRAELTAILAALRQSRPTKSLLVCTDSAYSIQCLSSYIDAWKRNGWKRSSYSGAGRSQYLEVGIKCPKDRSIGPSSERAQDILNVDLLMAIDLLISRKKLSGKQFKFLHLPSHCGIRGNEIADSLASLSLQR